MRTAITNTATTTEGTAHCNVHKLQDGSVSGRCLTTMCVIRSVTSRIVVSITISVSVKTLIQTLYSAVVAALTGNESPLLAILLAIILSVSMNIIENVSLVLMNRNLLVARICGNEFCLLWATLTIVFILVGPRKFVKSHKSGKKCVLLKHKSSLLHFIYKMLNSKTSKTNIFL